MQVVTIDALGRVTIEERDGSPARTIEQQMAITRSQINSCKRELEKYDYIGVKIATGCATREEYAEQIAHCQELRQRINELQKELDNYESKD